MIKQNTCLKLQDNEVAGTLGELVHSKDTFIPTVALSGPVTVTDSGATNHKVLNPS